MLAALLVLGRVALSGGLLKGGGGIGDLAIRFGYYHYQTNVMVVTVVALVLPVQRVQSLG